MALYVTLCLTFILSILQFSAPEQGSSALGIEIALMILQAVKRC